MCIIYRVYSISVLDITNTSEVIHSYLNGSLPGDFIVKLTVVNDISTSTTQRTITLMKSVNNLDLWYNVTSTPWNTTTFWVLDFGSIGTDACYLFDLGDSEAGEFFCLNSVCM